MAFRLLLALAAPAVAVALYQLGYAATAYLAYGEASIGLRMLTPSIGEGLVPLAGELFLPIVQSIHFHDQTAVANCTMGGLGTLAAAFFITGAVISRLRGRHPFGNARWAKPREHKAMKIVERDGVVLGKSERKVLRARDELHTLLVGPTRSGKGVGPIGATCFDWHGSMIVFDPKEEAYQRTAGYRAEVLGQKVYQFRPLAERTDRFNPLDLVRSLGAGGDGFTDLSAIANFLVPPSGNQPMWSNEAKALFLGVVGYVMESRNYAGRRNLAEVQRLFVNERGTVDLLRHVLDAEPELPEYVRGRLGAIVNMEAKATASGFVSQARASLVSFGNPRVAAATAASDFDVASLRTTKQTIYVTVSPEEIEQSAELLRLTLQMIANVISRTSPLNARGLHRVLFVIDEFAKFGHMPELTSQLPLMAGYGVNIMLAVQNLSQLDKIYTKDTRGDIVANCGRKIFLGFNDTATAREVSETMGDRTVFHTDTNVVRRNGRIESRQASSRAFGRPLMSVDELMRMPDDRYVLIQQHRHPVLGRKLNIYNDRTYAAWTETPLPEGMRTRTTAPYDYEGGISALQDARRECADRTGMPSDGLRDGISADEPFTKPRTLPSPSGKVHRKRQGDVTGSASSSPPHPERRCRERCGHTDTFHAGIAVGLIAIKGGSESCGGQIGMVVHEVGAATIRVAWNRAEQRPAAGTYVVSDGSKPE